MPGIVGVISEKPAEECISLAGSMLSSMQHEDFYVSGAYFVEAMGVYAGWTVHEKSFAAGQVFFNEQRDVALIMSGECSIDSETKASLKRKGHRLENINSWLVHLYEDEGEQFFERLNGLFSGLLIDQRQRKAFLFNDRYGAERIYLHQTKDAFYFASEAKAILSVLPELREFDEEGVAQFLAYGCTLKWRTLFRGIELLPGGSLLSFEPGRSQKRQYFSPETWESQRSVSAQTFQSEFESTFKNVLPRYFDSRTTTGVSLTGGLDTRMIMACRPDTASDAVCYTFSGRNGKTFDDRLAARVAAACGLEHRLLRIKSDFFSEFASHVDRTVYITDGCFGAIGAHEIYLNRQARQLAPVRLTGLFGSEILRGMSTFKPLGLSPSLVNPEVGQSVSQAVIEFAADKMHPIAFAVFRNVPWNLFGTVAASRSQVTLRTPYLDNEIVALAFQSPESVRRSPASALRVVQNNSERLKAIPTDRRIEDRDAGLVNKLRWAFFEASFKLDYLHNEGMPDWLLPWDSLLEGINSRVRIFGHHKFLHYRRWFRCELADYVKSVLIDAPIKAPFWNRRFLEEMADDHTKGRKNYVTEINAVLTLEATERLLFQSRRYARPRLNEFATTTPRSAVLS